MYAIIDSIAVKRASRKRNCLNACIIFYLFQKFNDNNCYFEIVPGFISPSIPAGNSILSLLQLLFYVTFSLTSNNLVSVKRASRSNMLCAFLIFFSEFWLFCVDTTKRFFAHITVSGKLRAGLNRQFFCNNITKYFCSSFQR